MQTRNQDNKTLAVTEDGLQKLSQNGELMMCVDMAKIDLSSFPTAPGARSDSNVIGERVYTILKTGNDQVAHKVSVTRGFSPEVVTVEVDCPSEVGAEKLFNFLKKGNVNPFAKLERTVLQAWNGFTAQMRHSGGECPYYANDETKLPVSPRLIPKPSQRVDPLTGLQLRPGFIKLFDTITENIAPFVSVGEIDIANLGATNEVCGAAFADRFFREMAEMSKKGFDGKIKLFRHGGDEFTFAIFGSSKADNEAIMKSFIDSARAIRDKMIAELSFEQKQELDKACQKKSAAKGRSTVAPALGLYVGMVTVSGTRLQRLIKTREQTTLEKGLVVQSILGRGEKAVYDAKTEGRFDELISLVAGRKLQTRSADRSFIENLRKIDERHDEIVGVLSQRERDFSLSRAERIVLFRLLSLLGAEDVSINNNTARLERIQNEWDVLAIDPKKSSEVYFDFPAGILNDLLGPDRTDEFFSALVSHMPLDYYVIKIRESGGGFRLVFPVNQLVGSEVEEIRELLHRRISNYLASAIQNINAGLVEKGLPEVDYISPDLLYVGMTPRQK